MHHITHILAIPVTIIPHQQVDHIQVITVIMI